MKFIHLSSLLLYFVTEDLANTLGQIKSKLQREDIYFLLGFVVWREAVAPCHRCPQNPQIRGDGWPSDGTASHAISSAGEKSLPTTVKSISCLRAWTWEQAGKTSVYYCNGFWFLTGMWEFKFQAADKHQHKFAFGATNGAFSGVLPGISLLLSHEY